MNRTFSWTSSKTRNLKSSTIVLILVLLSFKNSVLRSNQSFFLVFHRNRESLISTCLIKGHVPSHKWNDNPPSARVLAGLAPARRKPSSSGWASDCHKVANGKGTCKMHHLVSEVPCSLHSRPNRKTTAGLTLAGWGRGVGNKKEAKIWWKSSAYSQSDLFFSFQHNFSNYVYPLKASSCS